MLHQARRQPTRREISDIFTGNRQTSRGAPRGTTRSNEIQMLVDPPRFSELSRDVARTAKNDVSFPRHRIAIALTRSPVYNP